jgi:hypothetical protein
MDVTVVSTSPSVAQTVHISTLAWMCLYHNNRWMSANSAPAKTVHNLAPVTSLNYREVR